MIIFLWLTFSIVVGIMGRSRKIGGGWGFILSLLLSPLIGGIIVLASPTKQSAQVLAELQKANERGIAYEIQELERLLNEGIITDAEYTIARQKIFDHGTK